MSSVTTLEYFLLVIFSIAFLYYLYSRARIIFSTQSMNQSLKENPRLQLANPRLLVLRIGLYLTSVLLILSSVFFPYPNKEGNQELSIQGVDILFIVDTSLSMNSVDSEPTRLQRFKDVILSIIPELHGNRLGILAFAGSPFLYCPMTTDIHAFQDFIKGLDVDIVGDKGSMFNSVFKKADSILNSERVLRNRIIVLVSDGEDHSDSRIPNLDGKVIVWGIGDPMGAPIYYQDNETNTRGYVTHQGTIVSSSTLPEVVISIPNLDMLREIAIENQGEFHNITRNAQGAWNLIDTVENMNKNTTQKLISLVKFNKAHYNLFPAVGLLLIDILLLDFFIFRRRNPRKGYGYWNYLIIPGFLMLGWNNSLSSQEFLNPGKSKISKGIQEYNNGNYVGSLKEFNNAEEWIPDDPRLSFNKGTALLKGGKGEEAIQMFQRALDSPNNINKDLIADTYFNLAKAYSELGDYKNAHRSYRKALQEKPEFEEARKNLELLYKNQRPKPPETKESQSQKSNRNLGSNEQGKEDKSPRSSDIKKTEESNNRDSDEQIDREEAERIMDSFNPDIVERQKPKEKFQYSRDKFW